MFELDFFYSDCCDAEILCPDQERHGFCSECGDNATPVPNEKEPVTEINPLVLCGIYFIESIVNIFRG